MDTTWTKFELGPAQPVQYETKLAHKHLYGLTRLFGPSNNRAKKMRKFDLLCHI